MRLLATLQQRLFRWSSDGTAPLRLGQRRIFILPTRAGLFFAVALAVMLIGAINYNLALGHALVFLLAGLGLTGMIHTFRNLFGLHVSPGRCTPVFAGETALFPLHIGNDRPSARLALELAAQPDLPVTASLDPQASTIVAVPLAATQRGWLEVPRIRLSSRYPLGLFVAWSYLQPAMRCLVYPRPLVSPLPPASAENPAGQQSGDGGQEDFAGFRQRQPADSPRHVAWKVSARDDGQRPLQVKHFAGGAELELQLDWALTAPGLSDENRLSQLAGWVLAAEAGGQCYGLRLPGREIPAASGSRQRQICLEALALYAT